MRYDGVLICSDFDGTLSVGSIGISKENADAIKMFQSKGGRFTLATGRTPLYIAQTVKNVEFNAPLINVNGASIFDAECNKKLATRSLGDASEFAGDIFAHPDCQSVRFVMEDYSTLVIEKDEKDCLKALEQNIGRNILKLVYVFNSTDTPASLVKSYTQTHGHSFYFSRSWAYSVEVLNKLATKGTMLKSLKLMLPQVDLTVGIGDYENDIPLITEADIGYAVANAIDEVKKAADRVTVSCEENAIAKIIYEL